MKGSGRERKEGEGKKGREEGGRERGEEEGKRRRRERDERGGREERREGLPDTVILSSEGYGFILTHMQ